MTTSNLVFLPGPADHSGEPMGRFLPRWPVGAAASWLHAHTSPGSWVIDPFGASPHLALEAAQAGYRILVISNNPVTRFILETQATPPQIEDLRAALSKLAGARRGDDRLEYHIRDLYRTHCANCGEEIEAQAFLWERESVGPYARIYECPHCQQSGEFPTTDEDFERAARFDTGGPYRARALERVAASGDPNRFHVEEALDAYLPRAVYALFNIINKLDGLMLNAAEAKYLHAMILAACDQANNQWRVPDERFRPRQLITPPRFMEKNVWLALEEAMEKWATRAPATPLTFWPDAPPESGGICLYEGRIKDLAEKLETAPLAAVVSALPRPNQAYWTLCALWAGWLWGREAIGPFAQVLQRRRYDWGWHTSALYSALRRLAPVLPEGTPFFGWITENEAGFDAAAMTAADLAGFKLEGVALRVKDRQTQLVWHTAPRTTSTETDTFTITRQALHTLIAARGEPTQYLHLQAAGLLALSQTGLLTSPAQNNEIKPSALAANAYNDARQFLVQATGAQSRLVRYHGGKSSIEIGKWWPRTPSEPSPPLADRVEMALVTLLQEGPTRTWAEIDRAMCAQFPGLQTPDSPLLLAILSSYATETETGVWQLRENDTSSARRQDVTELHQFLARIGAQLGYPVQPAQPLVWENALNGQPLYFYLIASAILGKIISSPPHAPEQGVIVLPGGRAGLVLHKRERDPRLDYILEGGWRFLKFRQVRRMAENERLTQENLASYFALDPLAHDDVQMPLL